MRQPAKCHASARDDRPEQRAGPVFQIEIQAEPKDRIYCKGNNDRRHRFHGYRPVEVASGKMIGGVAEV